MKWSLRRELVPFTILAILAALVLVFYNRLPDPMPSHFNTEGKINGWMGKTSFFLLMGGTLAGIYLLVTFLPRIDPLRRKIEPRYGLILLLRDILLGFLGLVLLLNIDAALEGSLRTNLYGVVFGLLFIVLGNYLPKLPRNWFVGIRTPWTISSDTVWRKTHVVGGWLFVAGGLALVVLFLCHVPPLIPLLIIIGALLAFSMAYSYLLYKKLQKEGAPVDDVRTP